MLACWPEGMCLVGPRKNRPQKNLELHKIPSISKQRVRVSDHVDSLLFSRLSVEKQKVETDGCLQNECVVLRRDESGVSQEVEYIIKNSNLVTLRTVHSFKCSFVYSFNIHTHLLISHLSTVF